MSSALMSNLPVQGESKSSKKKKHTRGEPSDASGPVENTQNAATTKPEVEQELNGESPYIRELQKNMRNVKKKLSSMQKLDSIIASNSGKTLDQLLDARLINADQKVQAEKKPLLQSQLAQLEGQLVQFQSFSEELKAMFEAEKASLQAEHQKQVERVAAEATQVAKKAQDKVLKEKFLALSRFLRSAAAKRQDGDETTEENRAFEGALLLVYGGDVKAVLAMESIIDGSLDKVPTVEGELSELTFMDIRAASVGADSVTEETEAWVESQAQTEPAPLVEDTAANIGSDPTVVHASLTELDAVNASQTNGTGLQLETPTVPEASSVDASAANAAADANWTANTALTSSMTSGTDGWVDVNKEMPRDPTETETGVSATPAATHGTQSWAEDVPVDPSPAPSAPKDDGFHEVHHRGGSRGRGGAQGEQRGGRGRGGYGRGGGDGYRGRGGYRGGERGGRGSRGGGPRGGRGRGESS